MRPHVPSGVTAPEGVAVDAVDVEEVVVLLVVLVLEDKGGADVEDEVDDAPWQMPKSGWQFATAQ
jgi:hypothetical protein